MTDFLKMHGLGNDFIIFDWRDGGPATVSEVAARALADRRTGTVSYTHLTLPTS